MAHHPITELLLADRYDDAKDLFISTCRTRQQAFALAFTILEELNNAHRSATVQPIDLG
ncbi:hypothetical protein KNJ79_05170 [Sphingopyxis indica]|uniref:hypothetical protein n=1 Tax=Sphingopyxis indica TaxID=436663 RepID=UPI002938DCDE|nr:hypothetical protein [Sphingopyxis indica]WOF44323.1 hypothetical protein KNJ79_05170 [Sphingopyxis indica]